MYGSSFEVLLQSTEHFPFPLSRKCSALHRIIKTFSIVTFWNTFQMWNCSTDKRAGQEEDRLWKIITALLSHNYSALPQCLNSEFSHCKLLLATGVKTKKIIMVTPSRLPPTYKTQKKIFNCLWWLHPIAALLNYKIHVKQKQKAQNIQALGQLWGNKKSANCSTRNHLKHPLMQLSNPTFCPDQPLKEQPEYSSPSRQIETLSKFCCRPFFTQRGACAEVSLVSAQGLLLVQEP